jgi:hypothetical protein
MWTVHTGRRLHGLEELQVITGADGSGMQAGGHMYIASLTHSPLDSGVRSPDCRDPQVTKRRDRYVCT